MNKMLSVAKHIFSRQNVKLSILSERASDYCSTATQQFFSYVMARTSEFSMRL
jgi:hypothetical protein